MPGTVTSQQSSASNNLLSVDQLFRSAFHSARDPRSAAYKAGVRAVLAFRIEGKPITRPYTAGSAHDDAFDAGQTEGHVIWRAAASAATGGMPVLAELPQSTGLSESELDWARKFFCNARRIDSKQMTRLGLMSTVLSMTENVAQKFPQRSFPALRMIVGGAA